MYKQQEKLYLGHVRSVHNNQLCPGSRTERGLERGLGTSSQQFSLVLAVSVGSAVLFQLFQWFRSVS